MLITRQLTIAIRPDKAGQVLEQMLDQPLGEDNDRAAIDRIVGCAFRNALKWRFGIDARTIEVTIEVGWWQEQADEPGM